MLYLKKLRQMFTFVELRFKFMLMYYHIGLCLQPPLETACLKNIQLSKFDLEHQSTNGEVAECPRTDPNAQSSAA